MRKATLLLLALGCGSSDYAATTTPENESPDTVNDWSCIGQEPVMAPREPGRVQYVVSVVDAESDPSEPRAVELLDVAVCIEPSCSAQLPRCDGSGLEPCYGLAVGDQPHVLVFDFPYAFAVNPALSIVAQGFLPAYYLLGGPMVGTPDGDMTVTGHPIQMLGATSIANLSARRGALRLRTLDCSGNADELSQIVVLSGDVSPPTEARDDGFDSVLPQALVVEAHAPDGRAYGQSRIRVYRDSVTLSELRSGLGVWGQ